MRNIPNTYLFFQKIGKNTSMEWAIIAGNGNAEAKNMRAIISKVFLDHPENVEESYFEHMVFAGRFGIRLLLAAGAALIHAVIPCMFEKTAGNLIRQMHDQMQNR